MQDVILSVILDSKEKGEYLDTTDIKRLRHYIQTGDLRVQGAKELSNNAADIVKESVTRALMSTDTELAKNKIAVSRQYAACIRDLDYFLRYSIYAMLAGDTSILDERVLDGLKETYTTLGVSIKSTIKALQCMKGVTAELVGPDIGHKIGIYFDYICEALS